MRRVSFCDRCGTEARAGARFCANCGADLPLNDAESPPSIPARPEPTPKDRSVLSPALGIALLDASGLGLGHFLIRRFVGGVALVLGTFVVVGSAVGLPNAAAPFLIAAWLAVSGLIGYRAARKTEVTSRPRLSAGEGLAVMALIVAGYLLYAHASSSAYAAGLSAHRKGDCKRAIDSYDQVRGVYALSYHSFSGAARHKDECRDLLAIDDMLDRAYFKRAADRYAAFRSDHPGAIIGQDALAARQAHAQSRWAERQIELTRSSADPAHLAAAAEHYDQAVVLVAAYPAATKGFATVNQFASSGDLCARAAYNAVLGVERFHSRPGAELRARSRRRAPALLLVCGRFLLAHGHPGQAVVVLKGALATYPHSPAFTATRTTWIKAEVSAAHETGSGHLPSPTPAGSAPAGTATLVVGNDSKYRIQVFLDGPRTTMFAVPPCTGCSDYKQTPTSYSCDASRPSHTISLRPGSYAVEVKSIAQHTITPFTGNWKLSDGVRYDHCLFVVIR
jgi:zinc-ribbon domain